MVSASASWSGLYPEGVPAVDDVTAEEFPPRPTSGPSLNTDVEPWLGVFPGWGRIEVWADGSFEVSADGPSEGSLETITEREAALRFGWAELVARARLGGQRVSGVTVGLADSPTCALILGDPAETARLLRPLLDAGFAVLADRPAPVHWEDSTLIAEPCPRPVVMSCRRAESADLVARPVRGDTDVCAVDVPRVHEPRRVAAVLVVGMRRPHEPQFEIHTGHRSFEYAANILSTGMLDPTLAAAMTRPDDESAADPAEVSKRMAQHVRLASLPIARVLFTPGDVAESFGEALPWLQGVLSA